MRYIKYLGHHMHRSWKVAKYEREIPIFIGAFLLMILYMPFLVAFMPTYRAQINEWWENNGNS